jgi:hypothetical protein
MFARLLQIAQITHPDSRPEHATLLDSLAQNGTFEFLRTGFVVCCMAEKRWSENMSLALFVCYSHLKLLRISAFII